MALPEIIVGAVAAMLGYGLARRVLDRLGLAGWFTDPIWRNALSQLGELMLVVLTIVFGMLVVGVLAIGYGVLKAILG